MPRDTRQTRRARERRQQQRRGQPVRTGPNWSMIAPVAVVAAAILLFGGVVAAQSGVFGKSKSATGTPTPQTLARSIEGIGCNYGEQVTYHVHSHLTVLDAGKRLTIAPFIGFTNQDCLYWLHTHDASGIIHIEAPRPITPTLGAFFAVWHRPLSRHRVAQDVVKPGQSMKVWVDLKPYQGDPASIKLHAHTDITIEVGPPFTPPKKYTFPAGV